MKTFINKLIACCCILVSAAIISSCHKKEKIVPVSSITISSTSAELIIGETLQLSATVSPSTVTDKTVGWTSSNASIATVSPTGLVKAIAEGNCSISASCNGKTATCTIAVKKPIISVTSIELDKTDIIMYVGDEETLKATVKPDDATDKTITWGSSKAVVATVDSNGNVKAIADGVATITASCGGKTATCKVTVKILTYEESYFTIRALESGLLKWDVANVEYSLDRKNWNTWTGSYTFQKDDAIRFRSNNDTYTDKKIESTGNIIVEGNILSLIYSSDFYGKTTLNKTSSEIKDQFKDLFYRNNNLLSAENLILPVADTEGCFNRLFEGCNNLKTAPNLMATKLEKYCYTSMFLDCSSLTTNPYLHVENVPFAAYNGMYSGCKSITSATILGKSYGYYACNFMFDGCSNLKEIKCLNEGTIYARFQWWVEDIANSGTFIKSKS
ncbi:MAG: Ig domain-containing protein, partial [Bacteroidales bacterium]|nr:Ig domain-containing protein [Bacteroidales bacterium]